MKRKNKWLLSYIAIASLGISSVEARVPYMVAKYYLPYLLKVFGIEDKQRNDESLREREKIDHSNIETSGNGENGNEIIIDKENINGTEKWCKEKPTEKEQAILDLIYTDEGQEEMNIWANISENKGIFPRKLKVFLEKDEDKGFEKDEIEEGVEEIGKGEIPLVENVYFRPDLKYFNINVTEQCVFGGTILRSPVYVKNLWEKLRINKKTQIYLLNRLNSVNEQGQDAMAANKENAVADQLIVDYINEIYGWKKNLEKAKKRNKNTEEKMEKGKQINEKENEKIVDDVKKEKEKKGTMNKKGGIKIVNKSKNDQEIKCEKEGRINIKNMKNVEGVEKKKDIMTKKKVDWIINGKKLQETDKETILKVLEKVNEEFRKEKEDLKDFKLAEKLEDLYTTNSKKMRDKNVKELKSYLEENRISHFNTIEVNKVAKIIYLLCAIDIEDDLCCVINLIHFANKNENDDYKEIVKLKNIKDELLNYKEYDCRPMPNSAVDKRKVLKDLKIEKISTSTLVGDCDETLLRHLTTIALRHKNVVNADNLEDISEFGKRLVLELSAPQSGIMRMVDHLRWRDFFVREVINNYYKQYWDDNFEAYLDLDTCTEFPYGINSTIENISELMELIKLSICKDKSNEVVTSKKKMVGTVKKFVYEDEAQKENYEKQIENAMNGIYELSGKKETEGQRFRVKVLEHKNGTSEKCLSLEEKLTERYNGKTWYGKYGCDYLIVVSDELFNRTYISIINNDAHAEMVEVINEILVK